VSGYALGLTDGPVGVTGSSVSKMIALSPIFPPSPGGLRTAKWILALDAVVAIGPQDWWQRAVEGRRP